MRSTVMIAALATLAIISPACRTEGLAFREDDRVEIVSPKDESTVSLPFQLRWTVEDFDVVGSDGSDTDDAGYFAVLLDQVPQPPGEGLSYFARDDEQCSRSSGCPDEEYFADQGIYLTQQTAFDVTTLSDTRPVDRQSAPDEHEITLILLNGRGERIGESAFRVDIVVDRGQT
jgi:hypothetical protein